MGTPDEAIAYAKNKLLVEINKQVIPSDFLTEVTAKVARQIWSILDDVECSVLDNPDP